MTDLPTLEAAPAPAPVHFTPPEAANDTPDHLIYQFEVEGYEAVTPVDLTAIPEAARLKLIQTAVRSYIVNRLTTVTAKVKTDNREFDLYDAAVANDPLQTIVPVPQGSRSTVPYAETIASAIKALYAGEIGKRGRAAKGDKKERVLRDPLVTQITRAVVAEVFEKGRALDPQYKYPTAQKEVGPDGLAYLKAKIAAKVAAGAEEKPLLDFLETRYVRPARIMLGLDTPGKLKDADGIL